MKKQMEGDNEQRRAKAKEARDEGRKPSEDGVTTGASNQRRTLGNQATHEERLTGSGWGKQQPDRVAPEPKPGSTKSQRTDTHAPPENRFPPKNENIQVEPGELTEEGEKVFETLARIETPDEAPSATAIAREAGLSPDETIAALQRLVDRHDIVQQLPSDTEVGNRYRVKSR